MRILIVFAHPNKKSFCGSILNIVLHELAAQGHEIDLLDLYADGFDPVLSQDEWRTYENSVSSEIERYAYQIHHADGLVWIFPTWNYGLPAILKGYVDRVWKPNIAFRIDKSRNVHFESLTNLKLFIVITTFGASWLANTWVGNPCRRTLVNGLKRHLPEFSGFAWLAAYGMDKPSPRHLDHFLDKVRETLRDYPARFANCETKITTSRTFGRLLRSVSEWLIDIWPSKKF